MDREIIHTVISCVEQVIQERGHRRISESTCLVSGGFLDSISLVELVGVLEDRHGISFDPDELSIENFDSVSSISYIVQAKMTEIGK